MLLSLGLIGALAAPSALSAPEPYERVLRPRKRVFRDETPPAFQRMAPVPIDRAASAAASIRRAEEKRARKAAKLRALADKGAIASVPVVEDCA